VASHSAADIENIAKPRQRSGGANEIDFLLRPALRNAGVKELEPIR
jgi:hypothetical protein